MNVIPGILTVRSEASLEKAVANDLSAEEDLTENFLDNLSVNYPPKDRTLVQENPADEGSNRVVPDGQDFNMGEK